MRPPALAFLLLALSACTSVRREYPLPLQSLDAPPAGGLSRAVFYNDTNVFAFPTSNRIGIRIDGKGVAAPYSGEYVQIDLSSGDRANVPAGAEFVEGDVAQVADRAVQGAEVVYHLAAIPSVSFSIEHPVESHHSIVETTVGVLAAAEKAGVRRVVVASSSAVYGDAPDMPKGESHEPRALSPYALGKLCGEMYARFWASKGSLETVSLRFFNVFGPRQDPLSPYAAVIPRFFQRLQAGRPLKVYGDGEQTRDFTYVTDVARGMVAAGSPDRSPGPCYNIASGRPTSILELAQSMAHVAGAPLLVDHLPPRSGDIRHSWADVSRARDELGFAPSTSLDQGLRETLAWLVDRNRVAEGAAR